MHHCRTVLVPRHYSLMYTPKNATISSKCFVVVTHSKIGLFQGLHAVIYPFILPLISNYLLASHGTMTCPVWVISTRNNDVNVGWNVMRMRPLCQRHGDCDWPVQWSFYDPLTATVMWWSWQDRICDASSQRHIHTISINSQGQNNKIDTNSRIYKTIYIIDI